MYVIQRACLSSSRICWAPFGSLAEKMPTAEINFIKFAHGVCGQDFSRCPCRSRSESNRNLRNEDHVKKYDLHIVEQINVEWVPTSS